MRVFRRGLLALTVTAAVATVPLAVAEPVHAAAAAGRSVSVATTYRYIAIYPTADRCQRAGEAGLKRGEWDAYRCVLDLTGLGARFLLGVSP
jgi:hypothetical protein